jgi:hypothetical protein
LASRYFVERTDPFRSAVPIDPDQWFRLIPITGSCANFSWWKVAVHGRGEELAAEDQLDYFGSKIIQGRRATEENDDGTWD